MFIDMMDFSQILKDNKIVIAYRGPLWAEVIEGLASTLQKRLTFDEISFSATQSVFSVFVEQMNNMLMYSAEKESFERSSEKLVETSIGTSILGVKCKTYFLQTGNVMVNRRMEFIKSKIDFLNTLDKAELRKYYKEQIKLENTNLESKGAGLGLIEVARRASSKIEYSFAPYGDGLTFFSMYVIIG